MKENIGLVEISSGCQLSIDRSIGEVIKYIDIGAIAQELDYRSAQTERSIATAHHRCDVSLNCAAQALSRADGSRHSSHAWA